MVRKAIKMTEQRVKILWISSHAPYSSAPDAGGQTFNYYFKKISKDPRFNVVLVSLGNEKKKEEIDSELREIEKYIISPMGTIGEKIKKLKNIDYKVNPYHKYANLISNYYGDRIIKKVRELNNRGYIPEIIIFEWTNALVLAPQIKKVYPQAKLVASEHDVTFVGYKRKADYYKGLKKMFWRIRYRNEKKVELSALKLCDLILPHNPDNRRLLINEGIQEEKLQWLVPYFNNMSKCSRKPNGKDILFFGAMARPENYLSAIWFIEHVMPLIEDMNIRFVILGSNPPKKLREYENSKVHITGFIDSIVPYFEQSVCLVAPLVLGAGIKVKILEALSSGIPVITNNVGIEGIPAVDGKEYIHCEEPNDYARAIISLFQNNKIQNTLSDNAREFIKVNYSYEKSAEEYILSMLKIADREQI